MLYLVGGASRAGKSFVARKLLAQHGIPYFSTDILMMGFVNGYPGFGLDPDDSGVERGEMLWPILRAMAVNILEEAVTHPTYLLEGDALLPAHVAELAHTYARQVRACFMGYARIDPVAKLHIVRRFEQDWFSAYADDEMIAYLADQAEFSRYIQRECAAHGLAYFDCSEDLPGTVDQVVEYLLSAAER